MKEFFKSAKIKILLSTLLVLIMLAVFTNHAQNGVISMVVGGLTNGLSKVSAAATVDSKQSMSYDELQAAYDTLKKENAELRAQVVDYYDTKSENARLWKFYDLKKEHDDFSLIPATVLRRDPNDEFSSFTIDKGSASGISAGDAVVTENGLVGWISDTDATTAKVVTVLSPQTSIGAVDNESKDTGVLTGSAKLSDRNRTTFSKLSSDHQVAQGDIITTTGISGLYPKGLILGQVIEIAYDTFDTSYYAVIEPFDDIKELADVAVITGFDGEGEILTKGGADD